MIIKKIIDAKKYNKEILKAKLIKTEGSVPRNCGTFMLITPKFIFGSKLMTSALPSFFIPVLKFSMFVIII